MAYGSWVLTWFIWLHCAPALDMMVVSDIGEQWSPHTAPAMHAETQTTPIGSVSGKIPRVIGMRIPKVPQLVPVAKARKHPMRNTIAGRNAWKFCADPFTTVSTKTLDPRLSDMALRDQANVRISMADTIDSNPFGTHSIISEKLIVPRIMK